MSLSEVAPRRWLALLPLPLRVLAHKVEASQLGRRLAHGTFWVLIGTLLSRGLNMVAMIILARLLGKNEFGEFGLIQSTMVMAQTVAGMGLGWAATTYVAAFRRNDPAKAGRIIRFSILTAAISGAIVALIFFLSAPWLASHTLGAPHLSLALQLSSLFLFITTITSTQSGVLAGLEAFKTMARINLWSGVLSLPIIVGGGLILGVSGAIGGLIATNVITWMMNQRSLASAARSFGITLSAPGYWRERALLWQSSLPLVLGGTAFTAANWIGSVMLVNQPQGYGEMGAYSAASQWFAALLFLPGVLGQAAIPVLAEQIANKDHARARKILWYSMQLNLGVLLPIVLIGSLCSPWIMALYGHDFSGEWPTLVLTLAAAGLAALQVPPGQILFAAGKMWLCSLLNMASSLTFVFFAWWYISMGSAGVATGRVISYVIYAGLSMLVAIKLLNRRS